MLESMEGSNNTCKYFKMCMRKKKVVLIPPLHPKYTTLLQEVL